MKSRILVTFLVLITVVALLFTACAKPAPAPAPAPAEQYTMKIGSDHMPGLPTETALLKMKDIIESATNGNIKVEIYMASALGSQREMAEGLQVGTIEGLSMVTPAYSPFNPTINILALPFLFSSPERAYELAAGELADELLATFEGTGIVGGAIWAGGGFKQFTGNFPIHTPDDYIGKRIRVIPSPFLVKQFETLGASAVPIDFAELYTALKEGVVDGQENGIIAIHSMKFYEVQKYMALSSHGWNSYITSFSKKWMDQLPKEYQEIILDSTKEVSALDWKELARMEYDVWLQDILDYGKCEVYELTDAEKLAFKDKMSPLYEAAPDLLELDEEGQKLLAKFIEEGAKKATITEVK